MAEAALSQGFTKGRWQNIAGNKIPVKVRYVVKEKRGRKGGQRRDYYVTRTHWVLPEEAISRHYDVDFERIDAEKIELPYPSNLKRMHSHFGAEDLHLVSQEHKNTEIASEHRDERIMYDRNYHHFLQQQENWERMKYGQTRKWQRSKERIERKRKMSKDDRKELKELKEKIARATQHLDEVREREADTWVDKYNVTVEPDKEIKFKGEVIKAFAYSLPGSEYKIYQFSDAARQHYLWSKRSGLERFDRSDQAYKRLEEIFSNKRLRQRIMYKSFGLEKMIILAKAWSLIESASSLAPMSFDDTRSQDQIQAQFQIFSEFQSGDDKVKLEGDGSQYKVSINESPSIVTEDFREALAKYYTCVSKIIDVQNEDKDMGLEIFGDHVLQTSRNARRLMMEMDKSVEVDIIENMSYDELSLPFNEDIILKYKPVIKADPSSVFGIVPNQEEQGVGAAECGKKPSRGDLTEDDYKSTPKKEIRQEPIEEDVAEGPGISDTAGPAIITNSLDTNQFQLVQARQEENKEIREIEKPIKVKMTYTQKLRVPENRIIEEK